MTLALFSFTTFHSAAYFSQSAKFAFNAFVNTVEFPIARILIMYR